MKTRALYGFSPDLPPFKGKTPAEQVALLRAWGCNALFGGYQDRAFVDAAHAAEMRVYAELGCFVGKTWWDALPASRPITAEGRPLEPMDWYHGVNPTVPQIRQDRLAALEKLLADHDLDGVWLDFIRWPCHWEVRQPYLPRTSFDADTLARFSRDTGIQIDTGDPISAAAHLLARRPAEWHAWRCAQITTWVAEARATLKRIRPDAVLGLFGVPWRLADHAGAILDVIGQDYAALGPYVDVFSPMAYHAMCGMPVTWIGQVVDEAHRLTAKPVWPIIQSVDEPSPLTAEDYGQALEAALQHPGSDGVLVFTLKGTLAPAKLARTQAIWAAWAQNHDKHNLNP